jgi:predicted 3-demethylubiquinone-9 3-methyltransferase (glyoxalase superfamily)
MISAREISGLSRSRRFRCPHLRSQAEVDRYWDALTADGGEESVCGWLKDRYGVSWQVIPRRLVELTTGPDRAAAERAFEAMLKMVKIDVAEIERAARGEAVGARP